MVEAIKSFTPEYYIAWDDSWELGQWDRQGELDWLDSNYKRITDLEYAGSRWEVFVRQNSSESQQQ